MNSKKPFNDLLGRGAEEEHWCCCLHRVQLQDPAGSFSSSPLQQNEKALVLLLTYVVLCVNICRMSRRSLTPRSRWFCSLQSRRRSEEKQGHHVSSYETSTLPHADGHSIILDHRKRTRFQDTFSKDNPKYFLVICNFLCSFFPPILHFSWIPVPLYWELIQGLHHRLYA